MMNELSFALQPLTAANVPIAAEICGLSMAEDRHSMLKAAHPTNPYDHEAGMKGALEYWLQKPHSKIELVKAFDRTTGEMLGLIGWGKQLDMQAPEAAKHASEDEDDKPEVVASKTTVSKEAGPLERLDALTSNHLVEYQEKIMPPGTRCLYVTTLAVAPIHQRKGVGSALIKYGTDIADREGVICWVHSSDDAEKMYEKCGFELDDILQIDQDNWAKQMGIGPPNDRLGVYTFKYMVRKPR